MRRLAIALAVLVGCSSSAGDHPPPSGATSPRATDSPAPRPAPTGYPPTDAGADAADVADAGPLTLTLYPRLGDATDDAVTPTGPGLILQGGGDVNDAFLWARNRIAPAGARHGDVVVLTAQGGDQAQYFYGVAEFRSSQTISLPASPTGTDWLAAAEIVKKAELVYFPGGQQSAYVAWNGTPLMAAVQSVYDKGGIIAGSSAGTLILGQFVFDAIAAVVSENVSPAVALADPFDPRISFTRHMLNFPVLADAITEVHFEARDRMGRLAMFLARQHTDNAIARTPKAVLGIAVDDQAAVVIGGNGAGSLLRSAAAARAFVVLGGPPTQAQPGQRLAYAGLEVHRLDHPSQTFDFKKWCGTAPVYTLDVLPDAAAPYGPENPYDRAATLSPCP